MASNESEIVSAPVEVQSDHPTLTTPQKPGLPTGEIHPKEPAGNSEQNGTMAENPVVNGSPRLDEKSKIENNNSAENKESESVIFTGPDLDSTNGNILVEKFGHIFLIRFFCIEMADDSDEEKEAEEILDKRLVEGTEPWYLIKWKDMDQ